jgi:hypothetical protein
VVIRLLLGQATFLANCDGRTDTTSNTRNVRRTVTKIVQSLVHLITLFQLQRLHDVEYGGQTTMNGAQVRDLEVVVCGEVLTLHAHGRTDRQTDKFMKFTPRSYKIAQSQGYEQTRRAQPAQ